MTPLAPTATSAERVSQALPRDVPFVAAPPRLNGTASTRRQTAVIVR